MNSSSVKVFVIGATGETGLRLCAQLIHDGHTVTGLHRRPSDIYTLSALGVRPVPGDLLSFTVDELAARVAGSDVIVFAAGANSGGIEFIELIDGQGLIDAVTAAELSGVSRFILVSAFPEACRNKQMSPEFEHYMSVKKRADSHLASTQLEWVILRPGKLVNKPGIRRVSAGLAIPHAEVSRDDVAATICSLVRHDSVRQIIIELTNGSTPIDDAVLALTGVRSCSTDSSVANLRSNTAISVEAGDL